MALLLQMFGSEFENALQHLAVRVKGSIFQWIALS